MTWDFEIRAFLVGMLAGMLVLLIVFIATGVLRFAGQ